jgi:hypothetical protein
MILEIAIRLIRLPFEGECRGMVDDSGPFHSLNGDGESFFTIRVKTKVHDTNKAHKTHTSDSRDGL